MEEKDKIITFDSFDRGDWIEKVNWVRESILPNLPSPQTQDSIEIQIGGNITAENFGPVHIVLLACLIEQIQRINYNIDLNVTDKNLKDFIFNNLNMDKYFNGMRTVHVEAKDHNILNLWQIVNDRVEGYSMSVTQYFERTYFTGYDLTGFKNSLDEIYANVADHSQAEGNAFSFIRYDENDRKIHVAVCDFGLGIAHTLRAKRTDFTDDTTALRQSLEIGVTAGTNPHNRGFGLDNVVSNLSHGGMLRIVSNKALLFCQEEKSNIKIYPLSFDFKGTLIYFDVSIDSFEKEEVFDDITL